MSDPRGPFRQIIKVEDAWDTGNDWTLLYFECGHVGKSNPIYSMKKAKEARCFKCSEEA